MSSTTGSSVAIKLTLLKTLPASLRLLMKRRRIWVLSILTVLPSFPSIELSLTANRRDCSRLGTLGAEESGKDPGVTSLLSGPTRPRRSSDGKTKTMAVSSWNGATILFISVRQALRSTHLVYPFKELCPTSVMTMKMKQSLSSTFRNTMMTLSLDKLIVPNLQHNNQSHQVKYPKEEQALWE